MDPEIKGGFFADISAEFGCVDKDKRWFIRPPLKKTSAMQSNKVITFFHS